MRGDLKIRGNTYDFTRRLAVLLLAAAGPARVRGLAPSDEGMASEGSAALGTVVAL